VNTVQYKILAGQNFGLRENLADNILANSCIALYTFYIPTYKLAENILAKVADFTKFAKFFSRQNFVSYGSRVGSTLL